MRNFVKIHPCVEISRDIVVTNSQTNLLLLSQVKRVRAFIQLYNEIIHVHVRLFIIIHYCYYTGDILEGLLCISRFVISPLFTNDSLREDRISRSTVPVEAVNYSRTQPPHSSPYLPTGTTRSSFGSPPVGATCKVTCKDCTELYFQNLFKSL